MTTAFDQLRAERKKLPAGLLRIFRDRGFHAMYVAGPLSPVARYRGDNRGGWPVRIGTTASADDNLTHIADSWSPYWTQGVLFRVWTESEAHARMVSGLTAGLIEERSDDLRKAWRDLGPDTDLPMLEFEIHAIANEAGIRTWDDHSLRQHLEAELENEISTLRKSVGG